jgi:hypothetical protein
MPQDITSKIKIKTPKADNKVTTLYLYYAGKDEKTEELCRPHTL